MISEPELSLIQERLVQELRRGVLVLAALNQLQEARYGYSLIDELAESGLAIDQGTLYPLLRRLEADGLLESQWNTEGPRPRRYYVLKPSGRELLHRLESEWRSMTAVMERILEKTTT
jgi:DNA-binding PadR family transcriptional regulator